jgi:hypothetical protein
MEAAQDKHWDTVTKVFEKETKQMLKHHKETLDNVLKKFNKLMTEADFQLKINNFTNDALKKKQIRPRPMQTAIALSAAALVEEKVDCIVKVGTGEGKSLIMSMVSHMLLDQEDP